MVYYIMANANHLHLFSDDGGDFIGSKANFFCQTQIFRSKKHETQDQAAGNP